MGLGRYLLCSHLGGPKLHFLDKIEFPRVSILSSPLVSFGLLGCLLSTAWFTVMVWESASSRPNETILVLAICLSGFFSGVTTPLFYELSAEIIYPLKEGMSAGILVLLLNATSCITIFLNNVESGSSMNLIVTISSSLQHVALVKIQCL